MEIIARGQFTLTATRDAYALWADPAAQTLPAAADGTVAPEALTAAAVTLHAAAVMHRDSRARRDNRPGAAPTIRTTAATQTRPNAKTVHRGAENVANAMMPASNSRKATRRSKPTLLCIAPNDI